MKLTPRLAIALLLAAAMPALAASSSPCEKDPKASGIPERMHSLRRQMDRIEWTGDRDEQRRLLELHAKTMHEGMRELRRRDAGEACRMEMMHAMMEQMLRHQLALQDSGR